MRKDFMSDMTAITSSQLKRPTPELVSTYQLKQDFGFTTTENALVELFEVFPKNQTLEHILLKVAALNSLYNTNIYATYTVAEHIHRLNIDPKLAAHSLDLVNEIAVVIISGKTRRNYSFASKYCSWHLPEIYPIYDNIVEYMIWNYQKSDQFMRFRRNELQDYVRYREIIGVFRNFYSLEQYSFKEIDKFLWSYGREFLGIMNSGS